MNTPDTQPGGEAVPEDKPLSHQAKWNQSNPQAMWAHSALRAAIRRGLITRGPCEECGVEHGEDGAIVDGHHDDYSRPMVVRWLCRLHHRRAHKK